MKTNNVPASLILGISFILGMFFLGNKFIEARKNNRFVSVKGLAEQNVTADQGSWVIGATATSNDLDALKRTVNQQVAAIQSWLREKGFDPSEIKVEEMSLLENIYGNVTSRYTGNLQVSLSTKNVDLLDKTSGEVNELVEKGVSLSGDRWLSRPRFYFTQINDIKPALLAEATKAALISANEFADNSGETVGGIKQARQGIISLIPANRVSESEEFYKDKIARVVTSIDYFIE